MSAITIYGNPASTYVRTVRMTAAEKGVDYDLVSLTPADEELQALHPFRKIPAMRHGDLVLYETSAITRYIDEAFDGTALQPGGLVARARMNQWISAINDYVYDAMIRRYVLHYIFPKGADGQPDRTVIDAALPQIRQQVELIDRTLGEHDFLAADELSLADLFLAPILTYVSRMPEGGELLAAAANIQRAGAAMHDRSSFQDTLPPLAA